MWSILNKYITQAFHHTKFLWIKKNMWLLNPYKDCKICKLFHKDFSKVVEFKRHHWTIYTN